MTGSARPVIILAESQEWELARKSGGFFLFCLIVSKHQMVSLCLVFRHFG